MKARHLVDIGVSDLDIDRELKIVYRKEKHLGRAAQAFIEMARNNLHAVPDLHMTGGRLGTVLSSIGA